MHMIRLASAALSIVLAGCATTSSTSSGPTAAAEPSKSTSGEKMAITNVIPFDVAACGSRELTLSPLTAEVLTGAMLSMSPATQECFVDLSARDGQPFDLKAKVTVAEAGVTVEVTGLGASPSGKACVEGVFKKLPLQALPAGSKAVTAEIPVGAGAQTVRVGDNAANDVAGKLRLAQPSMCECYAKLGAKPAPMLKAEIEVSAAGAAKVNLGSSDELTTCLTGKMQAIKFAEAATRLNWPLLLKNSYATEVDASAPAALRFQQLDGMRAQRTADVLIAAGQRVAAAIAFDDLARKYKAKPSKALLDEVKLKCADVAAGDDKQIAAVKGLVAVLEDSQKLVVAEKAKDPQWAQVEPMLAQQLTTSTAEVTRVEEQKKSDLNACPKTKY
jgi:hypothetical protein